MKTNIK